MNTSLKTNVAPSGAEEGATYTAASYKKGQPRWCPGCGDHFFLASLHKALAEIGVAPNNVAVISGIGCSSRLPHYMATYGMNTIHGRAAAIATGAKVTNPSLDVWQVSGDGDGLAIGGNHFIHANRRNIDLNMILLNNRIYGLTKGQYSPTSPRGFVSKSSPYGTVGNTRKAGTLISRMLLELLDSYYTGQLFLCQSSDERGDWSVHSLPKHMMY